MNDPQQHASSSYVPFHNVPAKSREERLGTKQKQLNPDNVLVPVANSSLYMDDHSRFAAPKTEVVEYQRRQQQLQKKEMILENKRVENYHRVEKFWNSNIQAHEKNETRVTMKRDAGEGGVKRNKSGSCYNIITLDYNKSAEGQALQYKDQTVQYKSALRAQNLYTKTNSVSHNIITGVPLPSMTLPSRPVAPWEK